MDFLTTVQSIVLGAILALATSFVLELYKTYRQEKVVRKNLRIILSLELKNVITLADALLESYSSKNLFEYRFIDQLDRSFTHFESTRMDVVYIKDDRKKEEILTFFNTLSLFNSQLRGIENYANLKIENEDQTASNVRVEFCKKQREILVLKMMDLKRRAQDLITFFEV